jgi:hypothetical protein
MGVSPHVPAKRELKGKAELATAVRRSITSFTTCPCKEGTESHDNSLQIDHLSPHVPAKRELKDSYAWLSGRPRSVSPHVPAKRELKVKSLRFPWPLSLESESHSSNSFTTCPCKEGTERQLDLPYSRWNL